MKLGTYLNVLLKYYNICFNLSHCKAKGSYLFNKKKNIFLKQKIVAEMIFVSN